MSSAVPLSLDWDEVANGYNAYSIAQTAKDEYGHLLPLQLESFNDFKMPGYTYTLVPFVWLLGLSDFTVRLPSAIIGTLSVLVIYLMARKITGYESIGLASAAITTIAPWHLQFSRVAFEPVGVMLFVPLGVYLLLKGLEDKKYFYFSAISFAISFYFYYSVRVFVPLFLITLAIIYRKELAKNLKSLTFAAVLGAVLLFPIGLSILKPQSSARLSVVSVFSDQSIGIDAAIKNAQAGNTPVSRLINHRYVAYGKEIALGYVKHFSPQFLFISGDPNIRHGVRGMGVLYWIDLPFLAVGLIYLFKKDKKAAKFAISWILLSPLPAAFAIPTPHALRTLASIPIYEIVIACGVVYFLLNVHKYRQLVTSSVALGYAIFFGVYLNNYYVKYPTESAMDWGYGYRELYTYLSKVEGNYDAIYITGEYWKPYIYYLYYSKYDPTLYQSQVNHAKIGKYYFAATSWDSDFWWKEVDNFGSIASKKRVLFALKPEEMSKLNGIGGTIRVDSIMLGNKPVFEIFEKR